MPSWAMVTTGDLLNDEQWSLLETAHPREHPSVYDEVLLEVTARAASKGSLGNADIGTLLFWKRLQANTPWARGLNMTPESEVRRHTKAALQAVNDESLSPHDAAVAGREALRPLPGFRHGAALPSAVLLAAAPKRMAVYDRRALSSLHSFGIELAANWYGKYIEILDDLATEHNRRTGGDWNPGDVDLALFWLDGQK